MNKLKQYFDEKNTVKSATIILIVTLLLSNILGMLRDHFIAQKIPTDILDTYYAAFRIPDLIFNLLILGAIAAAFIPVFTSYIAKKNMKEGWHIANSFINLSITGIIIMAIIMAIIMPKVMPLIVPDFDSQKMELTIKLARIMLISPILFGLSYILGGILNSFKRFLVYSIAPLIYNLSIIIFTILFADSLGVYGVVFGVITGAFLHMLIQLPVVIKLGYRYQPTADWKDPGVKRIFRLMIPRAIGLGAMQILLLVYTFLASKLQPGSIAIFNLADNIQTMPVVVFGTSFATALFPSLSETFSLKKFNDFTNLFWKGTRAVLYLLIPSGIGVILLRAQIVRLILGSGHFGWEQTIETANILGFFAISLFAQGLIPLFARVFYSYQNTRTPMYVSIFSIITSIILGSIFAPIYGIIGLGLAFSIGSLLNALTLYLIARKKINLITLEEKNVFYFILKIVISTALMALVVQLTKSIIGSLVDMERFWGVLCQTSLAIIFGSGVYLYLTYLLKCEEIKEIIQLFLKRFNNGKQK